MGVFKMFSSSSLGKPASCSILARSSSSRLGGGQPVTDPRNPDPYHYTIQREEKIGRYLLLWVNYPNCTNYEGNKILVFRGVSRKRLDKQGAIDPHFSDSKDYVHPIARFVPTEEGWAMARAFAQAMRSS